MNAYHSLVSTGTDLISSALPVLKQAMVARDLGAVDNLYYQVYGKLHPRRMLEAATVAELAILRQWFETWDDVLRGWLFGDAGGELWRSLLIPEETGFPFSLLGMNAWWLREAKSPRPDEQPSLSPGALASLSLGEQARALGRALMVWDSAHPVDYQAIANALSSELRPFLAHWFLNVYLLSPFSLIEKETLANRESGAQSFAEFHQRNQIRMPSDPLLGLSGYRSAYFTETPMPFLRALATQILAPAFPVFARKANSDGARLGALLTCWQPDHPIFRCTEPLIRALRPKGLRGYLPSSTLDANAHTGWGTPASIATIGNCNNMAELAKAAERIASDGLEFLFFPEVGLSLPSRWLSTQRLARVQATTYGHPTTTGSSTMDYFVGGAGVERHGRDHVERLVLLPGVGFASTVPPLALRPRQRPHSVDGEVLLFNLSSFDKLNHSLLTAWSAILDQLPKAQLMMLPGVAPGRVPSLTEEIAAYIPSRRFQILPSLPRQSCVDLGNEADLYLDSFPFGGFNTIMDAIGTGCPVVTLEANIPAGRLGAAALRMLGLPEFLIVQNVDDYVAVVKKLCLDAPLRLEIRAKIAREHVTSVLCGNAVGEHFKAAVDWMLAEGPGSKGAPVVIRSGEKPRVLD